MISDRENNAFLYKVARSLIQLTSEQFIDWLRTQLYQSNVTTKNLD